jgi:hypothetical protein
MKLLRQSVLSLTVGSLVLAGCADPQVDRAEKKEVRAERKAEVAEKKEERKEEKIAERAGQPVDHFAVVEPGYVAPAPHIPKVAPIEEEVTSAPPAAYTENPTVQNVPGSIWVPGQWRWIDAHWFWRAGKWDKPKQDATIWADDYGPTLAGGWVTPTKGNLVWVHAHYQFRDGKHYWIHGNWQ